MDTGSLLEWACFAVCIILAGLRVPSLLQGRNPLMFWIFVLSGLAVLLSIRGPYFFFDSLLGSSNYVNLILRYVVFAAVVLGGARIARAFGSSRAHRALVGPPGLIVLAVMSVAVLATFLLMDTSGTGLGMDGISDRNPVNAVCYEIYAAAGRLYPAYVAAVLLPAAWRVVRGGLPAIFRVSTAVLGAGLLMMLLAGINPVPQLNQWSIQIALNYSSILLIVLGLGGLGLSRWWAHSQRVMKQ
ncbi:hypothetical protein ACQQCD_02225 [Pseudarthrobacter sp. J1763]|uniref:hypothetical protein n=1 Tax=Pseudarthrobacter sp. J1763 TaxID=3420445 RepID=UPI003D272159